MKKIIFVALFSMLSAFTAMAQQKAKDIFYAGSFSQRGSKGIYVLQFDRSTGNFKELQTLDEGRNPNFLAVHPSGKVVYAVFDEGTIKDGRGSIMTFTVNPATGKLTKSGEQSSGGRGPVHISLDPLGRFAYVAHYGGGSLSVLPITAAGNLAPATDVIQHTGSSVNPERQTSAHVHSSIPSPDGKFLYVSDLGMDQIVIYKVNDNGKLSPATPPFYKSTPGTGPRHFAFDPTGTYGFSVEEIMSSVSGFKVNKTTGELSLIERFSTIPSDFNERNSGADIHVSPDGKFLYLSNRGHNSLGIYSINKANGKLKLVGYESTGGGHPRNFWIDKQGDFVFVANRDGDNIVAFKRDKNTGKLTRIGTPAIVPAAVCIRQL